VARPETPLLATDCVIRDDDGRIVLVRRQNDPFKDGYALPGGFVDLGETVEAACRREVLEETGLSVGALKLVGVYSDPRRDPRGHSVSVAFNHSPAGHGAPAGRVRRKRRDVGC
jgi:8-oxo-dGTP diphosphatase